MSTVATTSSIERSVWVFLPLGDSTGPERFKSVQQRRTGIWITLRMAGLAQDQVNCTGSRQSKDADDHDKWVQSRDRLKLAKMMVSQKINIARNGVGMAVPAWARAPVALRQVGKRLQRLSL